MTPGEYALIAEKRLYVSEQTQPACPGDPRQMMDRRTNRFNLAVDAVNAAFTVIARHTVSSGTLDIIDMYRRLRTLREGDEGLLKLTLYSLNTLAASPRLFAFRLVTTALTQSLPRTCSARVTSQDIRTAALDLRQLANEAESLRAPDIAVELAGIIKSMLDQDTANRLPTTNDSLH